MREGGREEGREEGEGGKAGGEREGGEVELLNLKFNADKGQPSGVIVIKCIASYKI